MPVVRGSVSDTINPASFRCVVDFGNWIYNAGVVEPAIPACNASTGIPTGTPTPRQPQLTGPAANNPTPTHRWWGSVPFLGEMTIGDANDAATRQIIADALSTVGSKINEAVTFGGTFEVFTSWQQSFENSKAENVTRLNTAELDFEIQVNSWTLGSLIFEYDDGTDSDVDGVADGCDACPGYNDGTDSDADGVPDGCDVCAGYNDNEDADGDDEQDRGGALPAAALGAGDPPVLVPLDPADRAHHAVGGQPQHRGPPGRRQGELAAGPPHAEPARMSRVGPVGGALLVVAAATGLGSLLDERHEMWPRLVENPAYGPYWRDCAADQWFDAPPRTVPTLHVHGFWDQEDIYGAPAVYAALETHDTANDTNFFVGGPWYHGQHFADGSALGVPVTLAVELKFSDWDHVTFHEECPLYMEGELRAVSRRWRLQSPFFPEFPGLGHENAAEDEEADAGDDLQCPRTDILRQQ